MSVDEETAMQTRVLLDLRTLLEAMNDRLASLPSSAIGVPPEGVGRSSVEIKTSTRGIDVNVKAYAGSDIGPVGTAAMDEYVRVHNEMKRRLNGEADPSAAPHGARSAS